MLVRSRDVNEGVSIELTPIIDMVFLLLIFFLVATTFHQAEREMQIALPEASAAGPISATLREIVVNIDKDGLIIVGGKPIAHDELRAIISQAVENNADKKVTVRGDRGTAYANVVGVLDACKGSGIQEPYLDTVLRE